MGNADLVVYFLLRSCCGAPNRSGTGDQHREPRATLGEVGLDRFTPAAGRSNGRLNLSLGRTKADLEIAKVWVWEGLTGAVAAWLDGGGDERDHTSS